MRITREEMGKVAPAIALLFILLSLGGALIWFADRSLKAETVRLAAATAERAQNQERLSKIAEEERDVKEKLAVYVRLKEAHVLGEERRLEWADTMTRIRRQRELQDVRYTVEPQKLLFSATGKPANVDFFSSTMKLNMSLLHEGDLFAFLDDLRASGNAYYSIQRCALQRTGNAGPLTNLAPRVMAECSIDLVTIIDRAAKP